MEVPSGLTPRNCRTTVVSGSGIRRLESFLPHGELPADQIAILLECGLRRAEVAGLVVESLQQREENWVIADLVGKGATGGRYLSRRGSKQRWTWRALRSHACHERFRRRKWQGGVRPEERRAAGRRRTTRGATRPQDPRAWPGGPEYRTRSAPPERASPRR